MRRLLPLTALFISLVGSACDAPSAVRPDFAFDPTSLTNGTLYRWPSGSALFVYVEPDGSGVSALIQAASRAMSVWNAVPEFAEYTMVGTTYLSQADIVIYDRSVPNPLRPGSCDFDPRGSGYTYFCLESGRAQPLRAADGTTTNARVLISVDRGAVSNQSQYDAVVAHELGHALGIGGHSPDLTDVMFGAPTVARPSGRDRQTMHYVLGAQPGALLR